MIRSGLLQIVRETPVLITRVGIAATLVALAACSLDRQEAPPLAGPSELGLSLTVTASPDILSQDGHSVATIAVTARDAAGQPLAGVPVRLETQVGGVPVDLGTLSSKVLTTGGDGRAVASYRAPAAPPPTQADDTLVTFVVTPVGENYAGAVSRTAQLRLTRPGVIIPPGAHPTADFFFSPTSPREEDHVFFDASASTGNIVSYAWSFGDGRTSTTGNPVVSHHYGLAGTYNVVLTVTDDLGRRATSAPRPVTVSAITDPVASFTYSPDSPRAHLDVVNFNASASKAATDRRIVEYQWDFGDGSPIVTVPGYIVHHLYGRPATYTVVLRVKDDAGRVGVATQTVTIVAP